MSNPIQLFCIAGPEKNCRFEIKQGDSLSIGRGNDSDTKINDPAMSRQHCRVFYSENEIVVTDEGSSSGTFVNDQRVTSSIVKIGGQIRCGDSVFKVVSPESASEKTVADSGIGSQTTGGSPVHIGNLKGKKLGPFLIESPLAKGNQGVVFKALDTEKSRPAAIKVMLPQFTSSDDQRERFVRAMRTMLSVKHLHIVELYSAGKAGGLCWAAMEFIEGDDLSKLIERVGMDGILAWEEVWRCAVHITRALDVAYDRQIIHRNLTPTNIIRRTQDKMFKLGDFMLAKALEGKYAKQITQPGQLLGDLHYMPPERTSEDLDVDTRSDIYGLGATCYALLTGKPPASGRNIVDVLKSIRNETPESPKKYSLYMNDDFESVIMKMIQKEPDKRYATPRELLADLERIGKEAKLETDVSDWWVG